MTAATKAAACRRLNGASEVQGLTSRWVADDAGPAGLDEVLLKLPSCIAIATGQAVNGSLAGACCAAGPIMGDRGVPELVWELADDAPGLMIFKNCSHVALNFIGTDDDAGLAVASCFTGTRSDRFAALAFEFGLGGAPVLERALATFECENRPQGAGAAQGHWIFTALVRRYRLAGAPDPT